MSEAESGGEDLSVQQGLWRQDRVLWAEPVLAGPDSRPREDGDSDQSAQGLQQCPAPERPHLALCTGFFLQMGCRSLANLGWGPVLRLGVRPGTHLSNVSQGPGHKGVSRVPVQQAGAQQGGATAGPDRGGQHLPALLRGDEARCMKEGEEA